MLCTTTQAEDVDEQSDELSTIVVTATRLEQALGRVPASVSVVSGEQVQLARQQLSLDEALARVPGVFFQNRYNFAQDLRISIRGFGARANFGVRGIKILIDGMPETLADGQSQVDNIDLGSVQQVEVLRGPASALYGNASGGVINIRSELGSDVPFAEARVAAGDYGYAKYQLKTAGSTGRTDYLVSLSDLSIDGYRSHSEAENTQLNSRFRYRASDQSEFLLTLSASDQPISNDAGGVTLDAARADPRAARPANVDFDAGEALDQVKLGIGYRRDLAGGGELALRQYTMRRDFRNRLPFTSGGIVAFDRRFIGGGASYTRPYETGAIRHRLIVGVDYDRQRDARQRFDNISGDAGALTLEQDERVSSTGLFVQNRIELSDVLEVTVGMRFDTIEFDVTDTFLDDGDDSGSRTLSDLSPSAGFFYAINNNHALYGSIATAFETPTSTEFADPDGGGGFNDDLQPQLGSSVELGLRGGLGARSHYEIVAFAIDVDDELIPFEIAASPGRNYYSNAGQSRRHGIELAASTSPLPGLSLSLAYTWSRFEFKTFVDDDGNDFAGNTIPGVPESFAYADARYTHDSGFFTALDASYSGALFADNANTSRIDSSLVANLRAGFNKQFGSVLLQPFVGINNLTDTAFTDNVRINAFGARYYEPGPERHFYAGIALRYLYGTN